MVTRLQAYEVCASLNGGRCSCEAAGRTPCESILDLIKLADGVPERAVDLDQSRVSQNRRGRRP